MIKIGYALGLGSTRQARKLTANHDSANCIPIIKLAAYYNRRTTSLALGGVSFGRMIKSITSIYRSIFPHSMFSSVF